MAANYPQVMQQVPTVMKEGRCQVLEHERSKGHHVALSRGETGSSGYRNGTLEAQTVVAVKCSDY